jgi:hypothetical protein
LPLYGLPFFALRLLINPLASSIFLVIT